MYVRLSLVVVEMILPAIITKGLKNEVLEYPGNQQSNGVNVSAIAEVPAA
jgi:hypothetical protein